MPVQRGHFAFLDGLRGWAALAVVFYHLRVTRPETDLILAWFPDVIVEELAGRGSLGVAVFFVLSGMVIAYSLRSSLADRTRQPVTPPNGEGGPGQFSFARFMIRRVSRLTPPYYFAIVVALAFAAGAAAQGDHEFLPGYAPFSFGRLAAHLVYAQELAGFTNFNDVFWTLSLEMQFYAVFGVMVLAYQLLSHHLSSTSSRHIVYGLAAASGLLWPLGVVSGQERAIWFMPMWYSFMLGVLLFANRQRQIPLAALAAYVGVLLIAPIVNSTGGEFVIASAVTGATIWLAGERNWLGSLLADPVSQFLGRVSYSLYLLHTPVVGAAVVAVGVFGGTTLWQAVGLGVAVAASVVAAWIGYMLVEAPSIALARRLKRGPLKHDSGSMLSPQRSNA